ncbi:MAG: tetratricopeptide repeat protein [Acidobacteriota bacterium]
MPNQLLQEPSPAKKISTRINLFKEGEKLVNLGNIYFIAGHICDAIIYYEQALEIFHQLGELHAEYNIAINLGNAYLDRHEPDRALEYYGRALTIHYQLDKQNWQKKIFFKLIS